MSSIEQFFAAVLPSSGPYITAYKSSHGMQHNVFHDFSKMEKAAKYASEAKKDSYFCIGSIKDLLYTNKEGKVSPRNQQNISQLKSLILDIDVDEKNDKKYKTQKEALDGVSNLSKELDIPLPTIISSGYGLHIYISFFISVSSIDWLNLAILFKAYCSSVDTRITADPTRITDCSSLLRVPNTRNYKDSNLPKDVSIVSLSNDFLSYEEYRNKIEKYASSYTIPIKHERKKVTIGSGVIDSKHDFKTVISKCNWMKNYITHRKSEHIQPEWYYMIGVVNFLESPQKKSHELVHALSEDHPTYTIKETDKKIEQWKSVGGPATCVSLCDKRPEWCEGCIYKNLVSTPIRLDKIETPASNPIIEQEVVAEDGTTYQELITLHNPPFPYFRGKENGGVYVSTQDDEGELGEPERIYEYDMFVVKRLKDEETDNEMLEISLNLPMDGHRYIKIPNNYLTDPKKLGAALFDKGVLVHPKQATKINSYLIEYAKHIQRNEKAHEEFSRFGWRDVETQEPRFVMGDHVMDHKGETRRAALAPHLRSVESAFKTKGSLEAWKDAFSVYKDIPTDPFKFAIMMPFAAPLLALTPYHGMIYNMVGPGGCGKSTVLRMMTSVWGKPDEALLKVIDNQIPMLNDMGYLQSIPVAFDEITKMSSDFLSSLAYLVTEGRGKKRADRSGHTRVNTVHWKTFVCSTSNVSLYDKLGMSGSGNNAHAYRIFETNVTETRQQDVAHVNAARSLAESNYGLAGRVFMKYVLSNLQEVQDAVTNTSVKLANKYSMGTAERFWFTELACVEVGGGIAKALKLHTYDIDSIVDNSAKELNRIRDIVKDVEGDAFSILAHFLQTNIRSTIKVNDGRVMSLLDSSSGMYNLLIRMECAQGVPLLGYVSLQSIKDYCKHNQIEFGWLNKRLTEIGVLKGIENKSLADGTGIISGSQRCWKINLQHPLMQSDYTNTPGMPVVKLNPEKRVH